MRVILARGARNPWSRSPIAPMLGGAMDVVTRAWCREHGWSEPLPSELDGPSTLVMVYGEPALVAAERPELEALLLRVLSHAGSVAARCVS